jgi:hypothetical protein
MADCPPQGFSIRSSASRANKLTACRLCEVSMTAGWRFRVTRQLEGGEPSTALFIVAIPDHDTAACALLSKARLLDEKVETVGEADQALLDQYLIKTGSVFCVLDWS